MRVCYKDLNCYDVNNKRWLSKFDTSSPEIKKPEPRMYQASAVFGNIMFIHGGLNTEDKSSYSDLLLYDWENFHWTKLKRTKVFKDSNIGHRWMHTMTTVVSQEWKNPYSTTMWKKYQKDLPGILPSQYWGIYMFGGYKEGAGQTNDLFFIRPRHKSYK